MSATTPPLACLGGNPAPSELARDLVLLADLPQAARASLWSVLGPSLRETLDETVEAVLTRYCREHGLEDRALALAFKAVRHLMRGAAEHATTVEAFGADLTKAVGAERGEVIRGLLVPRYSEAIEALRFEIVRHALLDHGALLTGSDWRVDVVRASSRGIALAEPVALLTLSTKAGDRSERVTVQALPDTLRALRVQLDAILRTLDG